MAGDVADVMTADPVTLSSDETLVAVARQMRDADIGAVIVSDAGEIHGVVTDRDLVVRALAEGRDPSATTLGEVCTHDVVTVAPNDSIDEAVRLMREHDVRRLPVVQDGAAVGIVSLGDLAVERDSDSALADISSEPANN
jgi:CBS domain-containing protein